MTHSTSHSRQNSICLVHEHKWANKFGDCNFSFKVYDIAFFIYKLHFLDGYHKILKSVNNCHIPRSFDDDIRKRLVDSAGLLQFSGPLLFVL